MRVSFSGAGHTTNGALMIKAMRFIDGINPVFGYFSYGNEAFRIETVDEIGDLEAKTYGIGTTLLISPATGLTPSIEIQDREGGTKYFQVGLELRRRW
jgi:hypothetical protein